jgi:hypothetical protein
VLVLVSVGVVETVPATVLTLKCFKHRFVEENALTTNFVLKGGSIQVINGYGTEKSSAFVEKIKKAIADKPGITQTQIFQEIALPETTGREILQQWEGTHWTSKRGPGKTLRYFLKS